MTSTEIFTITEDGERLDKQLAKRYPNSRSYFQHLIETGCVLINGQPCKKRTVPRPGDEIEVCFQLTPELDLVPEDIPLDVLYEDEHIIAINKPAGMVTHPAPGNPRGTFANALLHHCKGLAPTGDPLRPGIVHRLDKDTSGVLIAAKTTAAHARLIEQFSSRQIEKTYLAITCGNPGNGTIDHPIGRHPIHRKQMACVEGGRSALTTIETLTTDGGQALVLAKPHTGRTHQIRVHLKSRGCPIIGDDLYGAANKKYNRHLLHAWKIKFCHPLTDQPIAIEAPVPNVFLTSQEFAKVIQSGM